MELWNFLVVKQQKRMHQQSVRQWCETWCHSNNVTINSQCPGCLGTGSPDVAVAMRDCGIYKTSQTCPVCKHRFSALPIDKTSSVEAQFGLLWRSLCSFSYRCEINAKIPSGLDSDRWIPHSRCCENPARAKALAGFSRHLSAEFTNLNPAPRGLSLYKKYVQSG